MDTIRLSDLLGQVQPSFGPPAVRWARRATPTRQLLPAKVSRICRNPNHPRKGDCIKVDPIRELSDIENIRKSLADKPRDLLLFTLGINTNLRASDLVRITVGQVRDLKPMDELALRERKTGKMRRISINQAVVAAIAGYLATVPADINDHVPLFISQRGDQALTVTSVHRMVKGWCRGAKLRGNYGSHSLRKTWGYHQRVTFGVDIPSLMVCFNHSNQRQTLDYLCVQADEIRAVYANQL